MRKYSAVLFDFDGVLCTDRFYSNIEKDFPLAIRFINETIFDGVHNYANRWMRGEFSYHEINKLISKATSVPFDRLTEVFIASVRQMRINPTLVQFALSLKQRGIKTALVTDNMDIFSEITIPEKRLADIFPVIINSFDHKRLKLDDNGKLFDIALEKLGLDSYKGVCLVDNSSSVCALFSSKGGYSYQYSGQKEFESWVKVTFFE
jgi:FMN phosphatase YigB (HAD superfamily)